MDRVHNRWKDYREFVGLYPSQTFFLERLKIELTKPRTVYESLDAMLAQLEKLWEAPAPKTLVDLVEAQLSHRQIGMSDLGPPRFPVDFHLRVATSLRALVEGSAGRPDGERHRADLAVTRLSKYLRPELQRFVLEPWFPNFRKFQNIAVLRCLKRLDDLSGLGEILVARYNHFETFEYLELISRDKDASKRVPGRTFGQYFVDYLDGFKNSQRQELDRSLKYRAMIVVKVMVQGGRPINDALMEDMPEIVCWALTEIGGPEAEDLLLRVMRLNPGNPELLWGVIRGAAGGYMPRANAMALELSTMLIGKKAQLPLLDDDEYTSSPHE